MAIQLLKSKFHIVSYKCTSTIRIKICQIRVKIGHNLSFQQPDLSPSEFPGDNIPSDMRLTWISFHSAARDSTERDVLSLHSGHWNALYPSCPLLSCYLACHEWSDISNFIYFIPVFVNYINAVLSPYLEGKGRELILKSRMSDYWQEPVSGLSYTIFWRRSSFYIFK